MKALAIKVDDHICCCDCAYSLARSFELPVLFFIVSKPIAQEADAICSRCGKTFGHRESELAAEIITRLLSQHKEKRYENQDR